MTPTTTTDTVQGLSGQGLGLLALVVLAGLGLVYYVFGLPH